MEARGRRFAFFGLVFAFVASAEGATYLPISDAELASQSPVIVRARVVGTAVRVETLEGSDRPFTIVTLEVLETIKGEVAGSTLELRLPGGRVGSLAGWIPGTPVFQPSQQVILLLRPAEGRAGEYHLSEFGLSRFDLVQDSSGRRFALRPAFAPEEDLYLAQRAPALRERTPGAGATPLRDADSLLCALRAAARGEAMPEVEYAEPAGVVFDPEAFSLKPEWVNIGGVEGSGNLFRWFWDTGASSNAVVSVIGTQSLLSDSSDGILHVQNGVDQWDGVPATDVRISGVTGGGNVTINLDAVVDFSGGSAWSPALPCSTGGTIGLGGPGSSSGPRTFKGDSPYFAPSSGTVSMRQRTGSAGCYNAATFRTAVMHEMGHVLGLGHPDQAQSTHSTTTSANWANAVMASSVPGSKPSTPQTDDTQAMQYYYGTGGGGTPPTANFTFSPPSPTAGQLVSFTDTSTGTPTSRSWNFNDPSSGGANTSSLQNPTHTFASGGTYNVSLTATNGSGSSAPVSHSVVVTGPPTANFTFSPPSPTTGQTVSFTDTSTGSPTSWSWNFGDASSGGANTSTLKNPTHAFATANTYTVTLTATNGAGSSTPVMHSIVVSNPTPPTAAFTFSPPSPVTGQNVFFSDTSTGSPTSWSWNFGDGTASTAQNPVKFYGSPNSYLVTLRATNSSGSTMQSQIVVVSAAGSPPTANFTFSPASPVVGQNVFFTDTSSGAPTSWFWTFGDGTTSSAQNPVKTYTSANSYLVMLTATNSSGSSILSRIVVVSAAGSAPTAAFAFSPSSPLVGQTVSFTDTSTGGPTSWTWSFGDPASGAANASSLPNPAHAFATAGTHTVSLTAQNAFGSNATTRTVTVATLPAPTAAFVFSPAVPQPGQTVSFTDTSTGGPTSWTWDHGDGSGSSFQNPSHAYLAAGTYTARLTASNASGSSQTTQTMTVRVSTPCPTDTSTLPANAGHNFCVTLAARDQRTGRTGPGLAIPQNDHFGYFSIPAITSDPINPEVFVKVLDGRAFNNFFWVFYGGLTDLEYTITVLDFQTGRTRQYTKPAGSASSGFDVLAFSGAGSVLSSPEAVPAEAAGTPAARVSPGGQAGCSSNISTLCLDSARGFTVTLAARDQRTGRTGAGQAIPQNDLFGYFSIPALTSDPTNPEVFVKVLDGRAINGHFWVFYGGLTDLEYTITVRDTLTGQIRTYFKSGGSADGGFDVLAF
jgi:PKD repeat protein